MLEVTPGSLERAVAATCSQRDLTGFARVVAALTSLASPQG